MRSAQHLILNSVEFFLHIKKGVDAGKKFRIYPPKISIGRDLKCQILVSDPRASRKQCSIFIKEEIFIKNESNSHPTLVDGIAFETKRLKPGNIISFGDTQILFFIKSDFQKKETSNQVKNQFSDAPNQINKSHQNSSKRNFYIFLGLIALSFIFLLSLKSEKKIRKKPLITKNKKELQIKESLKRQKEIKNQLSKKRDKKYFLSAEKHFIQGFRDLQKGRYTRALSSFRTTISIDRNHKKARQYQKIAYKKKLDLIDTHMRDGVKYKEKMMYNRCISELEKALVLIRDRKSQKFIICKNQIQECHLLKLRKL